MRSEPRWISKAAVLAIHERLLAEHGGPPGLIDEGRLDAALASPKHHRLYREVDLFHLAAVYAQALTRNHPFRDGNKRVSLTIAAVFLELNGFRLQAPEAEAVSATVALSNREMDEEQFAAWLRESSSRLGRSKARPAKRRTRSR